MKKVKTTLRFAFSFALLMGSAVSAEAKSWRINSDASKKPHFTDINAAMSSSSVPTRPQDGQLRVTQKVVLQGK